MYCIYRVYWAPAGCPHYTTGDWVYLDCSEPCEDIILSEGPCDGTYLMATSNSCQQP